MPFSYPVFILLGLVRLSIAQLTQRFLHPIHGDVLVPGSIFTIRWEAHPSFKNITLQLWDKTSWGFARDLLSPCHPWARNSFCGTIAANTPNTGSFDWEIPDPHNGSLGFGFPRGERAYWIKMYVEDYVHQEIGNKSPVLSYSENFAFAKEAEAGMLVTEVVASTAVDNGPGTVYVTVFDDATTTAMGDVGTVSKTATATRLRNATALVSVEGAASRLKQSILGMVMLLLGLL